MHPILFRLPLPWVGEVPIYTWGVMLGISLIVGWYLTLGLAERDGLPREMLANCYVITALAALLGARLLFVATNPILPEEYASEATSWEKIRSIFEVRSGGMVAYGGFLGGLAASWGYLRWKKFPIVPWADVGVPSVALGFFFTRLGCYFYGCDFGERLSETAPGWLRRIGTFPHWPEGTVQGGEGAEAWVRHVDMGWVAPDAPASLPVHPTQLYEAGVGLALFFFLLWLRKRQTFRGQLFVSFTFLYGFARFCLEFVRDDVQRGDVPPALPAHVLFPIAFAVFGGAFAFGIAPAIRSSALRLGAQIAFVLPVVVSFVMLRPAEFVASQPAKLSTSQLIGLLSAAVAAWGFSVFWKNAEKSPAGGMAPIVWEGAEKEAGEEESGHGDSATATDSATDSDSDSATDSESATETETKTETPSEEPAPKPRKKKKKKVSS
ncbi:MAG: prolipoprotein diacylglyceryl transferase [Polyangiaceae bacterium]|nr:prolipoprotein diacylglyceryl transferase [Polyangiaceae bacterium]